MLLTKTHFKRLRKKFFQIKVLSDKTYTRITLVNTNLPVTKTQKVPETLPKIFQKFYKCTTVKSSSASIDNNIDMNTKVIENHNEHPFSFILRI